MSYKNAGILCTTVCAIPGDHMLVFCVLFLLNKENWFVFDSLIVINMAGLMKQGS